MAKYTMQVFAGDQGVSSPARKFDDGIDLISEVVQNLRDVVHLLERDGSGTPFKLIIEAEV